MSRFCTGNHVHYASISIAQPAAWSFCSATNPLYRFSKRLIDVVFSILIIIFLSPLLVLIALAVKFTSAGPIIFSQKRVGQDGEIFRLYKFRSLYANSDPYARKPSAQNDPRVTPVGQFLRESGLDELPQFFNVLIGDMSIVGPRPEMEFIVKEYCPFERVRLTVKPGVTGPWQIYADRHRPIHENLDYDLNYLENRSLLLDLFIILETAIFMVKKILRTNI